MKNLIYYLRQGGGVPAFPVVLAVLLVAAVMVTGCTPPKPIGVNIDFGPNAAASSGKKGAAAVGAPGDYWNTVGEEGDNPADFLTPPLKFSDGSQSKVQARLQHIGRLWGWQSGLNDPMYNSYYFSTRPMELSLSNIRAGNYDLFLYGHGDKAPYSVSFTVSVGDKSYGSKSTSKTEESIAGTIWKEGVQYVVFTNLSIHSAQTLNIGVQGRTMWTVINGLQLVPVGRH